MARSTAHRISRPAPGTSAGGPRRARQAPTSSALPWLAPQLAPARQTGTARTPATLDDRALVELPKAHLHLHLVGSMRPSTLAEWCRRDGRPFPDLDLDAGGWPRFNAIYEAASASVRREDDLRRLVDELVEDQARDGARWVEITADPSNYHGRIGSAAHVLAILLDAGRAASARHGVAVGWVICANRSRRPDQALELAALAAANASDEVVGFGLANDERAAPTAEFSRAFGIAREAGLAAVPHAGELCGASNVAEAVHLLGATRVGHGVRALEDEAVLSLLVERQVTLEVCPTSNLALGVYEADWAAAGPEGAHPVERLRAAGVKVCLNADDPLLFGASLLDEYRFAQDALGWGPTGLASSAAASIDGASCPERQRRRLRAELACWAAAHGASLDGAPGF
ncbi:MAG: adenosine deaminase [Acidimicrobiia bacterium]|nr:adenosine deaminase [Acidimicrobiia bacterium]